MKKKFLVLMTVLCALCTLFALAACGGTNAGNTGNTGNTGNGTQTDDNAGTEGLLYQKRTDADGGEYAAVVGLGTARETDIVIASVYLGLPVKEISDSAFSATTNGMIATTLVTSISLPDSITTIGSSAFFDCRRLEKILVTENNQNYSSQDGILYDKAKTQIIWGPFAIKGAVTIPDSVTTIGAGAFAYCSGLTSVTIGSGVTEIGDLAFAYCRRLEKIIVTENNQNYSSRDGILYDKAQTQIIRASGAIKGAVTIPDSVTSIGYQAFCDCSGLTSIDIPDSVTSIGDLAFRDCSGLTSIDIPDSVTEIGDSAFDGCSGLTSVTIGSGVTEIQFQFAFTNCNGLEKILVKENNQNYSSQNGILYDKAKTQIIWVPFAIKGAVTIPDSVTRIGEYAFSGCGELTSLTIPDSVTSIGDSAFSGCSGLNSIVIPDSVTEIGSSAFLGCSGLEKILVKENNQNYSGQDGILYDKAQTQIIWVPHAIKGAVAIPDSVTEIGERVFYDCSGLTSVTIGNGVTSIGYEAFDGCSGLTSVTIGNGVTEIGELAFWDCSGLTSVTIGNSVTEIGERAFYGCDSLQSVIFGDPYGWRYADTDIAPAILQDPATAAEYLKSYSPWTWIKEK